MWCSERSIDELHQADRCREHAERCELRGTARGGGDPRENYKMIDTYLIPLLKILFVLNATLIGVTYMVLLERKVIAWVQVRLGPMRVGPYGILQPIADAVKLRLKEDITPARADKWVFTLAPIIVMVPALITFAVIPFGPAVHLFGRDVPLYI